MPLDTSNFHHEVLVYKFGTMFLYTDGVGGATGCNAFTPNPINNSTYPVTFASHSYQPNPKYLSGVLDQMRIYNRAMTDAEVQQLYQMGM
ncbi:MAG: LamG-like jellyroll fold domain-containing protein [Nitrosopumilaceae archaeon]